MVRSNMLRVALSDYRSLHEHILELTEEELRAALALEHSTLRRKAVLKRLIARIGAVTAKATINDLTRRFYVS